MVEGVPQLHFGEVLIMARERFFKVLKKIQTIGKILQIKKEEGIFKEDETMEVEEAVKVRDGLLLVLGAEKKDKGLLNAQITICQTRIKEDNKG